ncbi:MAG: hypothetical protein ABIX37_00800, partial [Gammaproteobacteria bacterium]
MVSKIKLAGSLAGLLLLAACGGSGGGSSTGVVNVTVTASGTHVTVTPITAQPFSAGGTSAFTVSANAGYTLDGLVGGTCPSGTFAGAVYTTGVITQNCTVTFSATVSPTTLSASASTLVLNAGGTARTLTISNTGSSAAFSVNYTATLPAGSTVAPSNCGDIAAAGTCVLTVTPGATASGAPGDADAEPVALTVSGSNTNSLLTNIQVLTYGSVLQGGYVFSIDDTTPATGSMGGKVAALADQAAPYPNGIAWSDIVVVDGVSETSTSPPDACNGKSDGACNTAAIIAANSPPVRDPAPDLSTYAAGLCRAVI